MSSVSTDYKANPAQNTAIGGLSIAENQTLLRSVNDALRQLMADAKAESDEVRALIGGVASDVAGVSSSLTDASDSAAQAEAAVVGLEEQVAGLQGSLVLAEAAAQAAASSADQAQTTVNEFASTVESNSLAINRMLNSISDLGVSVENIILSGTGANYVRTDGVTLSSIEDVLTCVDVAVDGNSEDPASLRGQIGRTAVPAVQSMDMLASDGWYAVYPTVESKPANTAEGIVHVASGYSPGSLVQTFIQYSDAEPRLYVRASEDGGETWLDWHEIPTSRSLGAGLQLSGGVVSAKVMEGADGSSPGSSGIVPAPAASDADRVLCGAGTWIAVPSTLQMNSALSGIEALERAFLGMQENFLSLDAGTVKDTGDQMVYGTKTFDSEIQGSISGQAGSAVADGSGNVITSTYLPNEATVSEEDIDAMMYIDPSLSPEAASVVEELVNEANAALVEIRGLTSGTTSLANRTTALEGRADTLETNATALAGRVTALETGQTGLAGRVAALETPITESAIDSIVYIEEDILPSVQSVVEDMVDEARAAATEARLYAEEANSLAARVTTLEGFAVDVVTESEIDSLFEEEE